jgi:hypothetical protein
VSPQRFPPRLKRRPLDTSKAKKRLEIQERIYPLALEVAVGFVSGEKLTPRLTLSVVTRFCMSKLVYRVYQRSMYPPPAVSSDKPPVRIPQLESASRERF